MHISIFSSSTACDFPGSILLPESQAFGLSNGDAGRPFYLFVCLFIANCSKGINASTVASMFFPNISEMFRPFLFFRLPVRILSIIFLTLFNIYLLSIQNLRYF